MYRTAFVKNEEMLSTDDNPGKNESEPASKDSETEDNVEIPSATNQCNSRIGHLSSRSLKLFNRIGLTDILRNDSKKNLNCVRCIQGNSHAHGYNSPQRMQAYNPKTWRVGIRAAHAQMRMVERMKRTLTEMARTTLVDVGMAKAWWGFSII